MPPVRRSSRRKRQKVVSNAEELEKCATRETIRFETSEQQPRPALYRDLLESLPSIISGIMSHDSDLQFNSMSQLFKLLSVEDDPPVDQVVELGAVSRLAEILTTTHSHLQCEAARVLKNIGAKASEPTKSIMVDDGVIPALVKLIGSSSTDEIKEQALFALGNIAAESSRFSTLILTCGALSPLLTLLNDLDNLSVLKAASWTLSNLCQSTPKPQIQELTPAIVVLVSLLLTKDELVLAEACWALAHLFAGGCWHDADVFSSTTCPKLIELIEHPSPTVVYSAIIALASVVQNDSLVERAYMCRADGWLLSLCAPRGPVNCITCAAFHTMERISDRGLRLYRMRREREYVHANVKSVKCVASED